MRGREFLDKMELLDPELVQEAAMEPEMPTRCQTVMGRLLGKPPTEAPLDGGMEIAGPQWNIGGWIAAALCLCAALLPVFLTRGISLFGVGSPSGGMEASKYAQYQEWHEGFAPEDYFKFNPLEGQGKTGIYLIDGLNNGTPVYEGLDVLDPEDENQLSFTRVVNNTQTAPMLETQCLRAGATFREEEATEARYLWEDMIPRAGEYTDFTSDRVYVVVGAKKQRWDKFERYVNSSMSETVTTRDGVEIRATGQVGFEKALWFTKDGYWYKLYGDPDISPEFLAEVLDWLWAGNADPDLLDKYSGDVYTIRECRKNFDDLVSVLPIGKYIPTDSRWCPELDSISLTNVNGSSIAAQCNYRAGDKAVGHWRIYKTNDLDLWEGQDSLGQLSDITREQIADRVLNQTNQVLSFDWDSYHVELSYNKVGGGEEDTIAQLWELFCYLREEIGRPDGEWVEQSWDENFQPEDLFRHESNGLSSTEVGMYFQMYNSNNMEQVYFTDYMDDTGLLSELYYVRSKPRSRDHHLTLNGCFNPSGKLQNLCVLWYQEDPTEIAFRNQSIFLVCGPGSQDFTATIEEGQKSGMTITDIHGTTVYALGGKYEGKILAFQNGTGWYFLQGEQGASIEDMAGILTYLLEHPIDFTLFTKENSCTYSYLNISAGELEEKLADCKLAQVIPSEWYDYMPTIEGATLAQRHGPEGTEDVELTLSFPRSRYQAPFEERAFIQGIDIFVDSDARWLGGVTSEAEAVLDMNTLLGLPSLEAWREHIQEQCGLYIYRSNTLTLKLCDIRSTYVRLSLSTEATIDQIEESSMDKIVELLMSVCTLENQREDQAQLMLQTWQKALKALGYKTEAEAPLFDMMLHQTTGTVSPCFGDLVEGPFSEEEVMAFLPQIDPHGMQFQNEETGESRDYGVFRVKWGEHYAESPIDVTCVQTGDQEAARAMAGEIAAILNQVRNMARPDTMGTIYTMGSSTIMTANPALRDALPDLFQSTTQLGVPVDWVIPVEDTVNVWLSQLNDGRPVDEQCIHSITVQDVNKNVDTMLVNARYLIKPSSEADWRFFSIYGIEAGEDGWASIAWDLILDKWGTNTWKVRDYGFGIGISNSVLDP